MFMPEESCRVEEVICFPCHSWIRPAPLPTKHIELIRFIYGKTDGPIIIKPRTVPFPFSNSWLHYLQEWRGGWRGKMVSFAPLEPDLAKQRLPCIVISSARWRNGKGPEWACDWLLSCVLDYIRSRLRKLIKCFCNSRLTNGDSEEK